MTSTTLGPLGPIDFDQVREQMRNAPGFPHFCIDGFLDPAFAQEVHDAFPSYADPLSTSHQEPGGSATVASASPGSPVDSRAVTTTTRSDRLNATACRESTGTGW